MRRNASATSPSPVCHPSSDFAASSGIDGFDLVAGTEAALVDELIADGRFRAASDRGGQDHFVLGERLFGEEGARKVQIAARPRTVRTELTNVADGRDDLFHRQRIAEGRHAARQPANPAALVHDGDPVGIRFRRRERTVREVRERGFEADRRTRRTPPVRAVAGDAGGAVDVLASGSCGHGRGRRGRTWRLLLRVERDDTRGREPQQCRGHMSPVFARNPHPDHSVACTQTETTAAAQPAAS